MGPAKFTYHFGEKVDELANQIYILLQPLTIYLNSLPCRKNAGETGVMEHEATQDIAYPTPEEQVYSLKQLLSCAAFLSIAIRRSSNIFHIVSVDPNSFFEEEEHESLDPKLYESSKKRLKEQIDLDQQLIRALKQRVPMVEMKAMAKIAVGPTVRVYKPGKQDRELKIPLEIENSTSSETNEVIVERQLDRRTEGFRILHLMKARCVFYWGVEDFKEIEGRPRQSLRKWLNCISNDIQSDPSTSAKVISEFSLAGSDADGENNATAWAQLKERLNQIDWTKGGLGVAAAYALFTLGQVSLR
jgi:hypothetical protein